MTNNEKIDVLYNDHMSKKIKKAHRKKRCKNFFKWLGLFVCAILVISIPLACGVILYLTNSEGLMGLIFGSIMSAVSLGGLVYLAMDNGGCFD